jgi:WD40 repeat protein
LSFPRYFQPNEEELTGIDWHFSKEQIVVSSLSGCIHIVCAKKATVLKSFKILFCKPLTAVKFLRDGSIVTGDVEGYTCFWEPNLGYSINGFKSHSTAVSCFARSPQGEIFVSGGDPILRTIVRTDNPLARKSQITDEGKLFEPFDFMEFYSDFCSCRMGAAHAPSSTMDPLRIS